MERLIIWRIKNRGKKARAKRDGGVIMNTTFRSFLNGFLNSWQNSSIDEMKDLLSIDYQAREITNGEIEDFGYVESINGWEQGFKFVKENDAVWELKELSSTPLRQNEYLVIISATLVINGSSLDTANLFFQTFKTGNNQEWKLVRSYIEAGVPLDYLKDFPSRYV